MNLERLRETEANFLQLYPRGFADPAFQAVRKKHNVDKLTVYAREHLTRENCLRPESLVQTMMALISRSSMVSRFEKPPFKAFLTSLNSDDQKTLAYAVEQRLFGRKQKGFEMLVDMHRPFGIAKWAVISALPFYFAPRREVFVKPTTAKGILALLEVDDLHYESRPTWAFYQGYRRLIVEIKKRINPSLSPSNAAVTGFLMMSLPRQSTPPEVREPPGHSPD